MTLGGGDFARAERERGDQEGAADDDEDGRHVEESGCLAAQHHGAHDHDEGTADTEQRGEVHGGADPWSLDLNGELSAGALLLDVCHDAGAVRSSLLPRQLLLSCTLFRTVWAPPGILSP